MNCDRCGVSPGLRWIAGNGLWYDEVADCWRWLRRVAFPDLARVRFGRECVVVRQVNLWDCLCANCERRTKP